MKIHLACLLAVAACGGEVVEVPPLGDYTAWPSIELLGPAPGHGDGRRVVYFNDDQPDDGDLELLAEGYRWDEGIVFVKEVYESDSAADFEYLAIMRRCNIPSENVYDDGGCSEFDWAYSGWLFTTAEQAGGEETHEDWCWGYCHKAAPYEGVFLDYSQVATP